MYLKCFISILILISPSYSINLLDICQSGIRDDGINYVHCARKSLTEIPRFSSNRLFNLAFDELILSDNFITHIHANAFHGLRIKRLIMSGNHLKSIDQNAFRELENYLEEIILEFDSTIVDRIPQAIQTNLINIKSLTLIGLNLRILPSNVFQQMKKLEYLNLKSCLFNFTRSLQCLTMDRNPLITLSSDTFVGLEHSLVNISLQSCSLTSESLIALSNLKNLERLKLQSNLFTKILPDNLFISMSKLLVLDLQRNQLIEIPSNFPSTLRELELGNNRLMTLPFTNRTFEQLSHLVTLDLSSNPLQCDCHMKPLYYWLLTHFQTELVPYVQWICSKPRHLSGKQLGTLSPQQFICEEKQILSFQVRLKDSKTALLEWLSAPIELPLNLIVIENNIPLPILYLNDTQNSFLLENLKPSTHYSLCLQIHDQILCRNITTTNQQIFSLSSLSASTGSIVMIDIEYLIIGISCGICFILLLLFFLILFLIKHRIKYAHSSKTTATTIDSYYQTTGSDIIQTAICNKSIEEESINSLQYHRSTPMFCYCQLPSNYCPDQQTYHFYHEIPLSKPPALI
ncbi:hypothetical protein I4U23_007058 [Adineta vaga]|nr:hypothetical protein I4U23_007058 [Adineta vaga]